MSAGIDLNALVISVLVKNAKTRGEHAQYGEENIAVGRSSSAGRESNPLALVLVCARTQRVGGREADLHREGG